MDGQTKEKTERMMHLAQNKRCKDRKSDKERKERDIFKLEDRDTM